MDYSKALQTIKKRQSKKIGNNTYLHKLDDSESLAIKLHNTDIMTIDKDDTITLNSGGWRTVTTKSRINEHLDSLALWQKNSVWYLGNNFENPISEFYDGMQIKNNEVLKPKLTDNKKVKNDKSKVKKFVDAFMLALDQGKIKTPSSGDCWDCLFKEKGTNETLGQIKQSDHVESHMRENYFVSSLLFNAINSFGISNVATHYLNFKTGIFNDDLVSNSFETIAKDQIKKALTRYIYRQIGYAS